jgi:hypothetical protein
MADDHQGNPFIDQLLHDLRLDQLPEPMRTELMNKITLLAERRVLRTILMNMDDATLDEFEQKLQGGMTESEAAQFMIEKVPGLAAKVEQALADLYKRLLADLGQTTQLLSAAPAPPSQPTTPLVMPAQDEQISLPNEVSSPPTPPATP